MSEREGTLPIDKIHERMDDLDVLMKDTEYAPEWGIHCATRNGLQEAVNILEGLEWDPEEEAWVRPFGAPVEPVPAPRLEPKTIVRPDDDGTPDDIVIDDVKLFRMERMDDNAWWIGLYFEDTPSGAPDRICFWVGAKRAKVDVSVTEESHARPITDDTSLAAPPVGTQE